jgi:hypothetical protein
MYYPLLACFASISPSVRARCKCSCKTSKSISWNFSGTSVRRIAVGAFDESLQSESGWQARRQIAVGRQQRRQAHKLF